MNDDTSKNTLGEQRLLHLLNPKPEVAPLLAGLDLGSFALRLGECLEKKPEIFFVTYYAGETGLFSAEVYQPTQSGWLVQDMDDDLLRRRPLSLSIEQLPVCGSQPFTGGTVPVAIWGLTVSPKWNKDTLAAFLPENVVLFWQLLPVFGATLSEYFDYVFSSSVIAKETGAFPEEFLHTLIAEKIGEETVDACIETLAELVALARYFPRLQTC